MTDPILLISMTLGLGGVIVLINSFSDDDDSDNDGGTGTYIYNLKLVKSVNNWLDRYISFPKSLTML